MRGRLDEMAASCLERGRALGAFTCYDLATGHGVIEAATELREPVAILISPSTAASRYGQELIAGLRVLADRAAGPVSVQLDHAKDLDLMLRSVAAGADAVLVDGSHLSQPENVELVRAASTALGTGVVLEAELGRISGNEDVAALIASTSTQGLTDPDGARRFVGATGVGLLAVSVGNVHGRYVGDPVIDLPRLDAIATNVPVPLVLHGASGLPGPVVQQCIQRGVAKVNVNTELRRNLLDYLTDAVPGAQTHGLNLDGLLTGWTTTVRRMTTDLIGNLANNHSRA